MCRSTIVNCRRLAAVGWIGKDEVNLEFYVDMLVRLLSAWRCMWRHAPQRTFLAKRFPSSLSCCCIGLTSNDCSRMETDPILTFWQGVRVERVLFESTA